MGRCCQIARECVIEFDKSNRRTILNLLQNVTTLGGLFNSRVGQLGQVLTRERQHRGSVLREDRDEVRGRGLVTVRRAPERQVGGRTQPSGSLDGLVGGPVLAETDRVVGRHLQDAQVRERRQTDGTGSVRNKVQECGAERNDTAIRGQTVADSSHAVLAHAETEVSAGVRAQARRGVLEVFGALPAGQVGTGQVGGTTHELGQDLGELVDGGLGQLAAADGGVGSGVCRQGLFPPFGQAVLDTALQLGGFGGVLFGVRLEQGVPLGFELVARLGELGVEVGSLFGDGERLVGVEAECLFELGNVVLLES